MTAPTKQRSLHATTETDGTTNDSTNWQAMQAHLGRRIRRQWAALQKLRGGESDQGPIIAQLAALTDDADSLWQLSERLEREVDAAFATRTRRVPLYDTNNQGPENNKT